MEQQGSRTFWGIPSNDTRTDARAGGVAKCASLAYQPTSAYNFYELFLVARPSDSVVKTYVFPVVGAAKVMLFVRTYDPILLKMNGTEVYRNANYASGECNLISVEITDTMIPNTNNSLEVTMLPDPAGRDTSHWILEGWLEASGGEVRKLTISIPNGSGMLNVTHPDGTIMPHSDGDIVQIAKDEFVTVSPAPESGFSLISWTIDGSPILTADSMLLMDQDHTVFVDFTGEGGAPPPGLEDIIIPPPPSLTECVFPVFSLNLWVYFGALFRYMGCIVQQILALLKWMVDAAFLIFRRLAAFLQYVLSLKWLTDFLKTFFDRLDVWISKLFGIDPKKPFFPELMKKILDYFFSGAEDAFKKNKW